MTPEASALAERLLAAYRPYVETVLSDRGWGASEGIDAAIDAGTAWLGESLASLLGQPYPLQQRGPLELFQEAMRFPTEVLAAEGRAGPRRDPAVVRALPGDVYDLAPESTRLLGEDVWAAHLAWGVAKADALRDGAAKVPPGKVVILSRNLMDVSRIEGAAAAAHRECARWPGDDLPRAAVVVVDLEAPGAFDAVAKAVDAGVGVVAYGPHRSVAVMEEARALGAQLVLPRSRFFHNLADALSLDID